MKKLMFALALVGFFASANANSLGDDKKKCDDKGKKSCCAKKEGKEGKSCCAKKDEKSCAGKESKEEKKEEKKAE